MSTQEINVNHGERIHPKCEVKSARPAADISWTIDGQNISSKAIVKNTLNNIHVNDRLLNQILLKLLYCINID